MTGKDLSVRMRGKMADSEEQQLKMQQLVKSFSRIFQKHRGKAGDICMRESTGRLANLKRYVHIICGILDIIAAALVLVGILLNIGSIVGNLGTFEKLFTDTSEFKHYLEQIFMLVIGIEFLEMLCRPSSENVIEVLIFLVARHMIVGDTTPYQDFVSVISVALLCVVRRYLRITEEDRKEKKILGLHEKEKDDSGKKHFLS